MRTTPPDVLRTLLLLIIAALAVLAIVGHAWAQEGRFGTHPEGPDPYTTLKQPGSSVGCCSSFDCRPSVWRQTTQGAQIKIEGKWCKVDMSRVLPLSLSGPDEAHVCTPRVAPGQDPCSVQQLCVVLSGQT